MTMNKTVLCVLMTAMICFRDFLVFLTFDISSYHVCVTS